MVHQPAASSRPYVCLWRRIDLLLGSKTLEEVVLGGFHKHPTQPLTAFQTTFRWAVLGGTTDPPTSGIILTTSAKPLLDDLLMNIWERETKSQRQHQKTGTSYRLANGRYAIQLPRKNPLPQLGNSRQLALKQLNSTEHQLKWQGKLKTFSAVLQEYVDLGHSRGGPYRQNWLSSINSLLHASVCCAKRDL